MGSRVGSDNVVMSREEFTDYLLERLDDPSEIGRVIGFIDGIFKVQNDIGRPVYIFEVDKNLAVRDIEYLQKALTSLGTAACLVPSGIMSYSGQVTSESFGVKNIQQLVDRDGD